MADLKWLVVRQQMHDECKRVAKAWGVPVQNVTLEFGIHNEEPEETWAFRVRLEGSRLVDSWRTYSIGDTFKEAADNCIGRTEILQPCST